MRHRSRTTTCVASCRRPELDESYNSPIELKGEKCSSAFSLRVREARRKDCRLQGGSANRDCRATVNLAGF